MTARGTILVVEDDDELRQTLADLLADEGYHVVCASNGREGLDALAAVQASLVLLDLVMPEMSGQDVYAAMQADPRLADIPVIVCTSDPSRTPPGLLTLK